MSGFNFFNILEKGDKELVHSAMLAYLIDNYDEFRIGFLRLPDLKYQSVELEKGFRYKKQKSSSKSYGIRFDVFIEEESEEESKHIVVIENKFKSAPEREQIKEYDEGLNKKYATNSINKILFCFDKKLAFKVVEGTEWNIFDYEDLLNELETGKYNGRGSDEKLFIEHYCKLLREYIDQKVADEKNANNLFKSGLDNEERFRRRLFNAKLYLELVNDEQFTNCGYALNPGNVSDPLLNIVPSKWITAFGFKLLLPFYGKELLLQLQGEDLKFYLHFDKEKKNVGETNDFLSEVRRYFDGKLLNYEVKKNAKKLQGSMFICKIKIKENVVTVEGVKKIIKDFYKECDAFLKWYEEEKK